MPLIIFDKGNVNKTELVKANKVLIKVLNLKSEVGAAIPFTVGKNTNKAQVPNKENNEERRS